MSEVETQRVFQYTHFCDPDSTAISGLYYNKNLRELLIVLHDSEHGYLYSHVDEEEFFDFRSADSVGTYYAARFKRPGRAAARVDYVHGISFKMIVDNDRSPIGTAKDLKPTKAEPRNNSWDMVVKFTVNGADRQHTVKDCSSIDEAYDSVVDLAKLFDIEVIIKEIVVPL